MVQLETIKDFARETNKKYFDGALKIRDIEFKISNRMVSVLGNFQVRRNGQQEIRLSEVILVDPKEWHNCLVHELVHAWQYQKQFRLGHGSSFKLMASRIRKVDPKMNITTTSAVSGQVREAMVAKRAKRDQWAPKAIAFVSNKGQVVYLERFSRIRPSDIQLAWANGWVRFYEFNSCLNLDKRTNIRDLRRSVGNVETREVSLNFQGNATFRTQINL